MTSHELLCTMNLATTSTQQVQESANKELTIIGDLLGKPIQEN